METVKRIGFYFVLSRLFFLLGSFLFKFFVPLRTGYLGQAINPQLPYLAWIWANFDGRHFLEIASIGYQKSNFVFFPLYPLSIAFLAKFLPITPVYLGILLSLSSFLIGTYFLYRLLCLNYSRKIAERTILLLFFFPTSFYFHAVYSTSFSFLFLVLGLFLARTKKWLGAGVAASLAVASHLVCLIILPVLFLEWLKQKRKFLTGILFLFLAGGGLVAYMIFLQINYQDPFLFFKSFAAWERNNLTFPLQVIFRYLKIFVLVSPKLLVYWIAVLEFLTFSGLVYSGIKLWQKKNWSDLVFLSAILLLSSLSGSFIGLPRYALLTFPALVLLSQFLEGKKRLGEKETSKELEKGGFLKQLEKGEILRRLGATQKRKVQSLIFFIFLILDLVLVGLFSRGYFVA